MKKPMFVVVMLPRQDSRRIAYPPGSEGGGLYLWAGAKPPARQAHPSFGESLDLSNCTANV